MKEIKQEYRFRVPLHAVLEMLQFPASCRLLTMDLATDEGGAQFLTGTFVNEADKPVVGDAEPPVRDVELLKQNVHELKCFVWTIVPEMPAEAPAGGVAEDANAG
ncbi:MAG: hypothetical protein KGL39_46835 [Patescibacteria group bacterium]|nr:hypothetical protein [Patescibacteria group bacterium]